MIKFSLSNILTAFNESTIGSKVTDPEGFWQVVTEAVERHDFNKDRAVGQAYIQVPGAVPFVSSGVGRNVEDPDAYVVRTHRGKVNTYLKRKHAAPVDSVAVVVYTTHAYLVDPDINEEPGEAERVLKEGATHILVAILASSGPRCTLSPYRFVQNLAGGNHEALAWSRDEILAKAREIADYTDNWSVVSD